MIEDNLPSLQLRLGSCVMSCTLNSHAFQKKKKALLIIVISYSSFTTESQRPLTYTKTARVVLNFSLQVFKTPILITSSFYVHTPLRAILKGLYTYYALPKKKKKKHYATHTRTAEDNSLIWDVGLRYIIISLQSSLVNAVLPTSCVVSM